MDFILGTLAFACILGLIWASIGIAWVEHCNRKFNALFRLCDTSRASGDMDTWTKALGVINSHLHQTRDYHQKSPLYWYQHWHDSWIDEVHRDGGLTNDTHNALPN